MRTRTDSTPERRGYQRVLRLRLLALLPVLVADVMISGYRYLDALQSNLSGSGADLRASLVRLLGVGETAPGVYDLAVAGLVQVLPMLALALLVGGLWERVFADNRDLPMTAGFVLVATLFTLLLPPATPIFHIIFGMTFAMVIGSGIFGGEGKSFLNPALLGFAILQISFPGFSGQGTLAQGLAGYSGGEAFAIYQRGGEEALAAAGIDYWSAFLGLEPGTPGTGSVLAITIGAILLLVTRVISWRLLVAQLSGLVLFSTFLGLSGPGEGVVAMPAYWHLLLGSFVFGAVFLACDPVASCCTNPGRWIQGFVVAALVVTIRGANSTHPDAVVPAILLGSILAPLIDHAVVGWNIRQRARRHV